MANAFKKCLVFTECAQKVAEARVRINQICGTFHPAVVIHVNETNGQAITKEPVTGNIVPVKFELCCQDPHFKPTLLNNKIINCGWVRGVLVVKNANTGASFGCLDVSLVFQEEQEVCGILSTDHISEVFVRHEGTSTCVVFLSCPNGAIEPHLILKCVFIVQKDVTRNEKVLLPGCSPSSPPCPCPVDC